MSETVAEFMQKPVKRYSCGSAARKAKKSLIRAFTPSEEKRSFQESALFEEIVDSVMQTKKGRETMVSLSKLGYSFAFEKGNFGGFCAPDSKKIVINPSFSFEYMLQTAVHEGRHAIQHSLKGQGRPAYEDTQIASSLRLHRAIEADAVAHEMAFVYECKDVLPQVYKGAKEQNLPMFQAYVAEMEKSGDERKAMQASFAAWYECDYYRDYYDKYYKKSIVENCEWGKKEKQSGLFSKDYPAEDVLKMCRYKGQVYMPADFLNKGLAFSIPVQDKKEISAALESYADAVWEKPDTSISAMRGRLPDGTLLPENKAVNAALVVKAEQKGR